MHADIVVLTVIAPELSAALRALGATKRFKDDDGTVYYTGSVHSHLTKQRYAVAVACIGQAGNSEAAAAAIVAIRRFSPKTVFLMGIAGGLRAKTRIGEVIFADRIVAYEGASLTGRGRRSTIERRPETERPPHGILQDVTAWLAEPASHRSKRMAARFTRVGGRFPRAKNGNKAEYVTFVMHAVDARLATLASGEKLFRNGAELKTLRCQVHGKIEGAEMEATGISAACRRASVPWLVVRGISDFGDKLKDDQFHEFASTTAACALADFITHGLQLEPSGARTPPRLDLRPYLAQVSHDLAAGASLIPRRAQTAADGTVLIATAPEGLSPSDGEAYFLAGWSGRGKTAALSILAARAFTSAPQRLPVYLKPDETSQLADLLRTSMLIKTGVPDSRILSWFNNNRTLLLIDDWDRMSVAARLHFERIVSAIRSPAMALVIAGTEAVRPILSNIHHLRLDQYTTEERDQVMDRFFGQPNSNAWISGKVPHALFDLLVEPILLSKLLQTVGPTRSGGWKVPHNLPELFRELLVGLLASSDDQASQRADEVVAVCARLAEKPACMSLPAVAQAIAACGVDWKASAFAERLYAAGIWRRQGALYVFEHQIWNAYFMAVGLQTTGRLCEPGKVAAWVADTEESELRSLLPFVSGLLSAPALQNALYTALLSRNLEMYLRSMRPRLSAAPDPEASPGDSGWSVHCLEQVRRGYLDLVDTYVPALKPLLDPWMRGEGHEEDSGQKVVAAGTVDGKSLFYYFGFAPREAPDVMVESNADWLATKPPRYSPKCGYSKRATAGDLVRQDSGRLLAAQVLFERLREISKQGELPPVGWIARERFRALARKVGESGALGGNWRKLTVLEFCVRVARMRRRCANARELALENRVGDEFVTIDLVELSSMGDRLAREHLGEVTIENLGLPGPDLAAPADTWVWSDCYSPQRRLARIKALYRATAQTYRAICEGYYTGLKEYFWYAQCPCRAVVQIRQGSSSAPVRLHHWWEVVPDWRTAMVPKVVLGEARPDHDALADQARADCSRFGRHFVTFWLGSGVGEWDPWEAAVTEEVARILEHDIRRIQGWFSGAT
jgi:nucleoside phosphorylase